MSEPHHKPHHARPPSFPRPRMLSDSDGKILIDQTPRRRIVVNLWPKLGAILDNAGLAVMVYGIHRGDDAILIGAILSGIGRGLTGFTSRQFNRSSQDNRIR